ncbi:MAG: flagellar basal body-associated FliL family protein [Bacillota bacterium]
MKHEMLYTRKLANMKRYLRWTLLAALVLTLAALVLYFGLAFAGTRNQEEPSPAPGPIYHVGEIVTDLAPSSDGRANFIQVDMKIRCSDADAYAELTDNPGRAKTEILGAIRSMTAEDVTGETGMGHLRNTIMQRLDSLLHPGRITEVYFVEFLIQ